VDFCSGWYDSSSYSTVNSQLTELEGSNKEPGGGAEVRIGVRCEV